MAETSAGQTRREAVAVFDDLHALEAAIDELEMHGFHRAEISLLAAESTVQEKLGGRYENVAQVENDPDAPRMAYVEREAVGNAKGFLAGGLVYVGAVAAAGAIVASGGTLAPAIFGALAGGAGGGAIGAGLASILGEQHGKYLEHHIEKGGIVVWVFTPDKKTEEAATDILSRHSGKDVHVHEIPARP